MGKLLKSRFCARAAASSLSRSLSGRSTSPFQGISTNPSDPGSSWDAFPLPSTAGAALRIHDTSTFCIPQRIHAASPTVSVNAPTSRPLAPGRSPCPIHRFQSRARRAGAVSAPRWPSATFVWCARPHATRCPKPRLDALARSSSTYRCHISPPRPRASENKRPILTPASVLPQFLLLLKRCEPLREPA